MDDTSLEPTPSVVHPSPVDILAFLPYACVQLQAPYRLQMVAQVQEEYVSKVEDKSKKTPRGKSAIHAHTTPESQELELVAEAPREDPYTESDQIVVNAVFDHTGHLTELNFTRCKAIPRKLMKIIGFCIPYHPLLTKLTIHFGGLPGETLYEMAKLVPRSQLTDICLDDSPVGEKNYYLLLEYKQLKRLSLARCRIDDDDCASIAAKLVHPQPASGSLLVLSLASNTISDVGARAIAHMLRSNRTLHHLNLCGNRITDTGALSMFRSLMEFPLTYEELITKRQRFLDHLRLRKEVYDRCMSELTAAALSERSADDFVRGGKRRTVAASRSTRKGSGISASVGVGPGALDASAARAEAMVNELVDAYLDPFKAEDTVSRDAYEYSVGNMSLCWLNLSYNDMGHASVAGLLRVLEYQGSHARPAGDATGLLRVLIEGNAVPVACREYAAIHDLLEHALHFKSAKPKKFDKSCASLRSKSKTK